MIDIVASLLDTVHRKRIHTAMSGDRRTEDHAGRLFRCSSCETVYIAEQKQRCSRCDVEPERVSSTLQSD